MACVARWNMMWLVWSMLILVNGALMKGCENPQTPGVTNGVAQVKISGQTFNLKVAADGPTRMRGLGGVQTIEPNGGMIFVFTPLGVMVQEFVMRDCLTDIDIIYTDGAGRVLSFHEMKMEPPRGKAKEGDPELVDPKTGFDPYESRLKRYSSRFPATFVIELAPGSIKKLNVKEGDKVEMDIASLKSMAR